MLNVDQICQIQFLRGPGFSSMRAGNLKPHRITRYISIWSKCETMLSLRVRPVRPEQLAISPLLIRQEVVLPWAPHCQKHRHDIISSSSTFSANQFIQDTIAINSIPVDLFSACHRLGRVRSYSGSRLWGNNSLAIVNKTLYFRCCLAMATRFVVM